MAGRIAARWSLLDLRQPAAESASAWNTGPVAPRDILAAAYQPLLTLMPSLDDELGWRATRCTGWTVRDLVYHLLTDAQRALVALHSPTAGPVDVDEVTYWRSWQPGTEGADAGRRGTRIMASAWTSVRSIADLYAETASAVLEAADEHRGDHRVTTQGKTITTDALLHTLAVEATIHQLDLQLGEPSPQGLQAVRHVLDGLLGQPASIGDDTRYALVGTGRAVLTPAEAALLGPAAHRLPLFG